MLRTHAVGVARAAVRAFATTKKDKPFLSDAIAKAAIGKDAEVATSFVSAFAPVVHQQGVRVASVSPLPETTGLTLVRDMKHDMAFRYTVGGAETAVMEVMPQHYSRALVEIQLRSEHYLPGRSLAHASGHYLGAVEELAKVMRAEKLKAKEKKEANQVTSRRKSPSKEPQKEYDAAVSTACVRVEPVHLLMLSDFCYAYDTADKVWRAPKSSSLLFRGKKYGWASPLFSTFRLTTDSGSLKLPSGLEDPGTNSFASSLRDRLSITIVHLPLVPSTLDDKAAWDQVVTLPEHKVALQSTELREWLYFLAHTSLKEGKVEIPAELQTNGIFRKSAEMAEELLGTPGGFRYSEKEMHDFSLQAEREREEALEAERAAAARTLGEAVEKERAAAAKALEEERAAATALRAELERLKRSGSGAL